MDRAQQPLDLTGHIEVDEPLSFVGGHGEIRRGLWNNGTQLQTIAMKLLRPPKAGVRNPVRFQKVTISASLAQEPRALNSWMQKLRREIQVWKRLAHENIVPLLGTVIYSGPHNGPPIMGMVSPWMENGNLIHYMENRNPCTTERLQLLSDVAAGLTHLHSKDIIHGDLTGANILINDSGRACLVDFGLSFIKVEFEGSSYWSSTLGGAMRCRAPELFPPLGGDVATFVPDLTSACDIYSFGSVMLHLISGKIPYFNIKQDAYILLELHFGRLPQRPQNTMLSDLHWIFITKCWDSVPASRPSAASVEISIMDFIAQSLLIPATS
ncbi:hypothetical protein HWV62_9153 [Athelia sp. TMB]|nr:hypothetical protein HWV62_9153 [Athelia sp. TMB]